MFPLLFILCTYFTQVLAFILASPAPLGEGFYIIIPWVVILVLNILDLIEPKEEMMEPSVHECLLNNHGDELVTDGANDQQGSLKPGEASNETNIIEQDKVTKVCVSGHLGVERLKESDPSDSEARDLPREEDNEMSGITNKPARVADLEVPIFINKSKKLSP